MKSGNGSYALALLGGIACLLGTVTCRAETRWRPLPDGTGIEWRVDADRRLPHADKIEMSGLGAALILEYGVTGTGELTLKRKLVWPWLRIIPNNTYGQYSRTFEPAGVPTLTVDGRPLVERPRRMTFDGVLTIESDGGAGLSVTRRIFPSASAKCSVERIEVRNGGDAARTVRVVNPDNAEYRLGCTGRYLSDAVLAPMDESVLAPAATRVFTLRFAARRMDEPVVTVDGEAELRERRRRVTELTDAVVLETGDAVLDTAFRLAKIRAGESIFRTRGGVLHSPGGEQYYAATWCNDEVEYAGPWFAMTGDALAMEASLNAYLHYMPFMAPDFKPIPSSVIAEGNDIWNGVGDRGDAAMWAYGATRFALAAGRRDWAERLRPGIRWTLEYCRRRLTPQGVVASDTDELETRLPSGKANLCTSSLYCDALRHAAYLERDLGDAERSGDYERRREELVRAIDAHFGAEMHGWQTYRYYEGCTVLRSWIGIPLCMGIETRAADTTAALFSEHLWNGEGMLCMEGDRKGVTWDRSLLYAMRGVFAAGLGERVLDHLQGYSRSRLLGEHVPYPVEAWPEGGRRHLSAESALYCRIFTEGLFKIDPVGLDRFAVATRVPAAFGKAKLRKVRLQGRCVDLEIRPDLSVQITGHK